jgi:SAM-dependent methyltransferase
MGRDSSRVPGKPIRGPIADALTLANVIEETSRSSHRGVGGWGLRMSGSRPDRRTTFGRLFEQWASSWRARLARLRRSGGRSPEPDTAYDEAYWERFYESADPWGFADNSDEIAKYSLTLDLCGSGPFGRALEIGCSEGMFTQLLAPRCNALLAVDISSVAVARARERVAQYPWVEARAMPLPAGYPDGPFDLIVASDVLYYWATRDLPTAASRIEASLAPGGRFVALHYALPIDHASTGDIVHDLLADAINSRHVHSETRDIGSGRRYRIDVWQRPIEEPAQAQDTPRVTLPALASTALLASTLGREVEMISLLLP